MFSFAGDAERETLAPTGLSPGAVFPAETLHMRLTAAGVRSVGVMPRLVRRFHNEPRAAARRRDVPARGARRARGLACSALAHAPVYASVYLPTFDAVMHRVGPDAPAAHAELVALLDSVHRVLLRVPPGTLVLLGTDHGMAPVSPERTTYVNVVWP